MAYSRIYSQIILSFELIPSYSLFKISCSFPSLYLNYEIFFSASMLEGTLRVPTHSTMKRQDTKCVLRVKKTAFLKEKRRKDTDQGNVHRV